MIRFLLRIYPAAWRAEYGDELTALLGSRKLTLAILADIVSSGLWERARGIDSRTYCAEFLGFFICASYVVMVHEPNWATFLSHWFWIVQVTASAMATASCLCRGIDIYNSWWGAFVTGIGASMFSVTYCIFYAFRWADFPAFCDPKATSVPGCGVTTLFVQSSFKPDLLIMLLFVGLNALWTSFVGGFVGIAIGRLRRAKGSAT